MLSDDKIFEWKQSECTQALLANFDEACETLINQLIYEENPQQILITQGLIRAYKDALTVIENIKDELEREGENGRTDE